MDLWHEFNLGEKVILEMIKSYSDVCLKRVFKQITFFRILKCKYRYDYIKPPIY